MPFHRRHTRAPLVHHLPPTTAPPVSDKDARFRREFRWPRAPRPEMRKTARFGTNKATCTPTRTLPHVRRHTRASASSHDPRIHEWSVGYQWAYARLPTRVHPFGSGHVQAERSGAPLSRDHRNSKSPRIGTYTHIYLCMYNVSSSLFSHGELRGTPSALDSRRFSTRTADGRCSRDWEKALGNVLPRRNYAGKREDFYRILPAGLSMARAMLIAGMLCRLVCEIVG